MAIPSGQVSFSDVNTNTGSPSTTSLSSSSNAFRILANGDKTTTPISISSVRGKSWTWTTNIKPSDTSGTRPPAGGIAIDSNSNIFSSCIVGVTGGSRILITKTDPLGTVQFVKYLTAISGYTFTYDYPARIVVAASGNIYVTTGLSSTPGNANYYYGITKMDSSGTILWSRYLSFSTSTNFQTETGSLSIDSSENIYLCPFDIYDSPSGSNAGTIIAKWNSSGTLQWQKKISNMRTNYWGDGGIKIDSVNNYAYLYGFLGSGYPGGGGTQGGVLAKFDTDLTTAQWQRAQTGDVYWTGDIAINTTNQNVYMFGRINPGVIKYNSQGVLQWQRVFSTPSLTIDRHGNVATNSNDELFVAAGESVNTAILRISSDGSLLNSLVINQLGDNGSGTSPNHSQIFTDGNSAIVMVQTEETLGGNQGCGIVKLPKSLSTSGIYDKLRFTNSTITSSSGSVSNTAASLTIVSSSLSTTSTSLVTVSDITSSATKTRTLF